jgi:molybdopterin synthase sulfur carrier subunit
MTSGPSLSDPGVEVMVRYWASARAAAGCDTETLTGQRVGDVLEAAASAHTGLGAILRVCTILLDGHPVTTSQSLSAGVILEVLPPFAGG